MKKFIARHYLLIPVVLFAGLSVFFFNSPLEGIWFDGIMYCPPDCYCNISPFVHLINHLEFVFLLLTILSLWLYVMMVVGAE